MKGFHFVVGIALATILSPASSRAGGLTAREDTIVVTAVSRTSTIPSIPVDQATRPTMEPIDPEIRWALGRFESAGLELPDLTFVVFDSTIDCDGSGGYYFAGRKTLYICQLDEKTVLHELAHAWADQMLTDAQRRSFAEFRGADGWNNVNDEWKDRATEQAAETIAWALTDEERTVKWVLEDGTSTRRLLTIDDSSPSQLAEAYRRLTGLDLPVDRQVSHDQPGSDFSPEVRGDR